MYSCCSKWNSIVISVNRQIPNMEFDVDEKGDDAYLQKTPIL